MRVGVRNALRASTASIRFTSGSSSAGPLGTASDVTVDCGDGGERPLPMVISPPQEAGLPMPLMVKKRSWLGSEKIMFDNPWAPGATAKSFQDLLKMLQNEKPAVPPTKLQIQQDLPFAEVDLDALKDHGSQDPMRVTWIGHATLLLQMHGMNLLTDPMFSDRASASQNVGPKRYAPPGVSLRDIPPVDVVLLSHNHYDHLDLNSVIALGNNPLWVVPVGIKSWMTKRGITNCVELNWWDELRLQGGNMRVVATPAQHWSMRVPWDRNHSLWCGYAVTTDHENFYFAGDTAYCPIFPKIAERYGPFDIAALPIGAHEPTYFMKGQHCSPEEAVTMHQELQSKRSIGIHWGTFPLAADQHDAAPRQLVEALRHKGIKGSEFSVLRHGESITVGTPRRYKCVFGGDE